MGSYVNANNINMRIDFGAFKRSAAKNRKRLRFALKGAVNEGEDAGAQEFVLVREPGAFR